jgi:calcium/calmodulin-dependent protein kinase I
MATRKDQSKATAETKNKEQQGTELKSSKEQVNSGLPTECSTAQAVSSPPSKDSKTKDKEKDKKDKDKKDKTHRHSHSRRHSSSHKKSHNNKEDKKQRKDKGRDSSANKQKLGASTVPNQNTSGSNTNNNKSDNIGVHGDAVLGAASSHKSNDQKVAALKTSDDKSGTKEYEVGNEKTHCVKDSETGKSIKEFYEFGRELGRGGFSIVIKAKHKTTGKSVAIKIIDKKAVGSEWEMLKREIGIMRRLKHPNIIELYDVFDEDNHIYMVLELVTGGMLFDQIVSRGSYSEADAANIVKQILEAVAYMHANGIAHRDLKPENLLCTGKDNKIIKVTDFGLSKSFGDSKMVTACGTPEYAAPEVVAGTGNYDNAVDIWSVGVITYILLCGYPPFYGRNDGELFERILRGEYNFPSPDWDGISDEAKDFIKRILVVDPKKRMTSEECFQHPWLLSKAPQTSIRRLESLRGAMKLYVDKKVPKNVLMLANEV